MSLREKMTVDMEMKGLSKNTQVMYLKNVEKFALFFKKSPDILGTFEIKEYLHHMIVIRKMSHSYVNSTYSALKFLYTRTLNRKWNIQQLPRTKSGKKLPAVLSVSEIASIFDKVTNLKHKAILLTIYAAGLRVSEAVHLKVTDIDSKNMQIRVQQAKGKKDRYTLLSNENLKILRVYWQTYRPNLWLFPSTSLQKPLTTRSVQKIFAKAKTLAGIQKDVSVHTLRHCFATHLLEAGTSVYHIQNLLGHTNPRTTNIYLHLTRKDLLNVRSPLDILVEST